MARRLPRPPTSLCLRRAPCRLLPHGAHRLLLARPFLACTRCGSLMQGSGRGDLLSPCNPRFLQDKSQRKARLAKLERGMRPYGNERIAQARALLVDDDEVGWLALTVAPE